MSDVLQVTVVGRLTRDAELREAGSSQVCGFRVAAKPYKAEESLFFDCSVWGRRGESLVQYLGKGQQVVVIGSLSERKYEAGGEQRSTLQINASEVALVGAKGERSADTGGGDDEDAGGALPF